MHVCKSIIALIPFNNYYTGNFLRIPYRRKGIMESNNINKSMRAPETIKGSFESSDPVV